MWGNPRTSHRVRNAGKVLETKIVKSTRSFHAMAVGKSLGKLTKVVQSIIIVYKVRFDHQCCNIYRNEMQVRREKRYSNVKNVERITRGIRTGESCFQPTRDVAVWTSSPASVLTLMLEPNLSQICPRGRLSNLTKGKPGTSRWLFSWVFKALIHV